MSDNGHGGKRPSSGRPKGGKNQQKKNKNDNNNLVYAAQMRAVVAERTAAQHKHSERRKDFGQKSDEELRELANTRNPYDAKKMAAKIEIKRRVEEEEKRKKEQGKKKEHAQIERAQREQKEEEEAMAGLLRLAQDADEFLTAGAEGYNKHEESEEDEAEDYEIDTEAFLAGNPNKSYSQSRRNKSGYKPSKGSILYEELENFREKFMTTMAFHRNGIAKGRHEFPPEFDPVSKDGTPDPKSWYTGRCKKFVYLPFHQYHNKAGQLKDYECIHCHEKGDLESKMFAYRPMFNFAEIVWLYHRRLRCKKCFGTFAEIHPDFLSQLPTIIAERLPFLTTGAGLGVHRLMLYQFMHMATKGILYGTFVSIYNELYRVDHDIDHCSFLDATADYQVGASALGIQAKTPEPFAPFHSPGEYNGILLRIGVIKHLFYRTMDSMEAYMQKSFQSSVDNGESPDHTFKFANGLKLKNRPGKVFTASYTSVSLQGKVTLSRPTYTKSNAEIEPIVAKHHEARKNAGEATLDIYQSDGGSDQNVWRKEFKQDLARGMTPFTPTKIDGLPCVYLEDYEYIEITTRDAANDWCLAVMERISESNSAVDKKIYYGLDCEWNWRDGTHELTRAVQIYFLDDVSSTAAFFNLGKMQAFLPDAFPRDLKRLLELENLVPVGVNIPIDIARLRKLGVNIKHWIDISLMAKELDEDGQKNPHGYGMKALCARHLSTGVDKCGQDSDWAQDPLPSELVHYGVLDSCLSVRLFHVLQDLLQAKNNSFPLRVDSKLNVSRDALYACRRDKPPSATVEIVFIGGLGGEQRKWGTQTVGKGKSLVRLKKVHNLSAKPPFSFTPSWQERNTGVKKAWNKRSLTLQKVLEEFVDPVILVLTSKLSLPASALCFEREENEGQVRAERKEEENPIHAEPEKKDHEVENNASAAPATTNDKDVPKKGTNPSAIAMEEEEDLAKTASASAEAVEYIIGGKTKARPWTFERVYMHGDGDSTDDFDDLLDKTRDKRDIFHVFDELPIPRNNPAKSLISRLLIHGTFLFDDEDYENVAKYMAEEKEIDSREDLLKDFYFRREWWRQRVRMYTPRGSEHASNIRVILDFVEKTDAIKDELDTHTLEEVQKYLERFAEKCEEGRFEELSDVNLFQWNGKDRNGLDLWLRLRGSTRTENVHQKMRVAFGPWSTGVRTGHYLLLLICYRYNVSTGINRCNAHDFGHKWLHYIDRIDLRLQEIYGKSVYPRHINLSLFEPLKNFVSVGTGPLFFDEVYVESGDADDRLSGDLLFLAMRMRVKCPPLPLSSREEYALFNAFILLHPKPTDLDLRALAKEFKAKSDCTTIFPKLPSMLKVHYKKWKDTNLIKMTEAAMKKVYNELLQRLATPVLRQACLPVEVSQAAVEDTLAARDTDDDSEQNDGNELAAPLDVESGDEPQLVPGYKLQVAPINAPRQVAYVPAKGSGKTFNCYYFPFCKRKRHECGGNERGKCRDVISGKIRPEPSDEEINTAKMSARSEAKAERRRKAPKGHKT
jgi:hypothetical protein